MSTFSRFKSTAKMATDTTLGSLGIAIPLVILPAAIYGFADMEIMGAMNRQAQQAALVTGEMNMEQSLMIKAALQLTGLDILLELIFGPIIAAAAVYTVTSRRDGRTPTLHGALNFAMSRYGRLFKWHAAAQLSIKLGMLILIPGVLFMMMYAMVDPVLCFEKEQWPLDRSKRLTRAWRKTIFMFMLPWVVLVAVIPLLLFWSTSQGGMMTFGLALFYFLSLFWLQSGFGYLYAERIEAGRKAAARREEAAAAAIAAEAGEGAAESQAAASNLVDSPAPGTPARKGVEPMGLGQKLGLSVVAVFVGLMVYAVVFENKPVSMDPAHVTGGQEIEVEEESLEPTTVLPSDSAPVSPSQAAEDSIPVPPLNEVSAPPLESSPEGSAGEDSAGALPSAVEEESDPAGASTPSEASEQTGAVEEVEVDADTPAELESSGTQP